MPKGIIEVDLAEPSEEAYFELLLRARDFKLVLEELYDLLKEHDARMDIDWDDPEGLRYQAWRLIEQRELEYLVFADI